MKVNLGLRGKSPLVVFEDLLARLAMIGIVVMMLLTTADVIGRYLFNAPVIGTHEITEILMALVVLLCLPSSQRLNVHVGVDLLEEYLKQRDKQNSLRAVRVFNLLVPLLLFGIITWSSGIVVLQAWRNDYFFSGFLRLPSAPFLLSVPVGSLLLILRLAIQIKQEVQSSPVETKAVEQNV